MLRFAVNISMLFKEVPFLERFDQAAQAGFGAVEFLWPAGIDLNELVAAKEAAGVEVALFNIDAGDMAAGDRGFLSHPNRQDWWRDAYLRALDLAQKLGCWRLNALAGNELPGLSRQAQLDCAVENIAWALPRLEETSVTLMLEALNRFESPHYLLYHTGQVLELLDRIDSAYVRYQYDVYHMQRMEGNLIATIRAHIDRIGHLQLGDAPDRHQPGTGEINFRNVLGALEAAGYDGYVSLEYNPPGRTEDSLAWLPRAARQVGTVDQLHL